MYRKSARPKRAQSSPRLSGNGNHEPKKLGPSTGSHRMLPPAVSMNIPAWPRPVILISLLSVCEPRRVYAGPTWMTGGRAGTNPSALQKAADVVGVQRTREQVAIVEHRAEQLGLALLERGDLLLDRPCRQQPVDEDAAGLPAAVRAVHPLRLRGRVPTRVQQEHGVRLGNRENA